MNTKKAIYEWWEGLGNQNIKDDMSEFKQRLESPCYIAKQKQDLGVYTLLIKSPRWKHGLFLLFHGETLECFKIVY